MGRFLGALTVVAGLLAMVPSPGDAAGGGGPRCRVASGERVVFRRGAAFVTGREHVVAGVREISYYACERGVGRRVPIALGSADVSRHPDGDASEQPEGFVIAGDYLGYVQVDQPREGSSRLMKLEQWNLRTAANTLDPDVVEGSSYYTPAPVPVLTESRRGALAWVNVTDTLAHPRLPVGRGVITLSRLTVFADRTLRVIDTATGRSDGPPSARLLGAVFTDLAITGSRVTWERLGRPRTAQIP